MGTWGLVGRFSFFSNKNMTTGEGGMVVTNDDEIAQKLHILRSHGMTSMSWDRHRGHAWSYDVVELGYNYCIDEIRAALGRIQLCKLDRNNEQRQNLTTLYREQLQEIVPSIIVPFKEPRGIPSCHIMPVLLPDGIDRPQFMERMKSFGIQTSIHYPPIHKFKIYSDGSRWNLPLTEDVVNREVTIALYPTMSENDVAIVVQAMRDSLNATMHG